MPLFIREPTANETPDSGQGGTLAVTGISNTGHSSTVTSCGSFANGGFQFDSDAQSKSARWFTFLGVGNAQITKIRLKFSWLASGSTTIAPADPDGAATASCFFTISYNLGAGWLIAVTDSTSGLGGSFTNNGSAEIVVPVTADISLIQVRDRMVTETTATGGEFGVSTADASVTVTVSDIKLEITLADDLMVIMM